MTTTERRPRWLELDGTANTRWVVPGALLRSDNLQDLTDADVARLVREHRVTDVVDLRTDVETHREGPAPLDAVDGVAVQHRSLHPDTGGHTDLDADTVSPWGSAESAQEWPGEPPVVRAYLSYLRRRPDSVVAAIEAIARADGATLVHCAAGKDRTGVIVALAQDAVGVDRAQIDADYLATRERVGAVLERLRSSPTYADELQHATPDQQAPDEGTMPRFFALLDEMSGGHPPGSAAWLTAHGLSDEDLARLRSKLRA